MDIRQAPPSGHTSDLQFEFDITSNEEVAGFVRFESDQLTFQFEPTANTGALECKVELREYLGGGSVGNTLLDGTGTTRIEADQSRESWLIFSSFGWEDEQRTELVSVCHYQVSLPEGDSTVRVIVGGERLEG